MVAGAPCRTRLEELTTLPPDPLTGLRGGEGKCRRRQTNRDGRERRDG